MGSGPVYPEYSHTIWTQYGPIHFYVAGNWPEQPWLDTSTRLGDPQQ